MSSFLLPNWATGISGRSLLRRRGNAKRRKDHRPDDRMVLKPTPVARLVTSTCPPKKTPAGGQFYLIVNAADAAEALTVKDDAGNTIGTVSQNEIGLYFNSGLDDNGDAASWVEVFNV